MARIPLLAGTRVVVADAPDDAVVLRPPPPGEAIADVAAAVRDALRFPLAGNPLEALVRRGGRATIVVESPTLPIPSATRDPRQEALAATVEELERCGIESERQTILLATGLARRAGRRELELLLPPEPARRFRGRAEAHDAESPDLVELGAVEGRPLRVHPALVETDLVVTVTAAETAEHGGPAAFVGAAGRPEALEAPAPSLAEPAGADAWQHAVELERTLSARVPTIGVSLALNHPELGGAVRGYPYEPDALKRVARSPLRFGFGVLPGALRARVLQSLRCEITAAAVFSGPPSVAHAEALLRAIELRSTPLDAPLDAIVVGIPRTTPYLPRERPNPLLAAFLGLGLALRLWRDAFPVVDGGTAILVHRFHRAFAHPTQQPYRAFFSAVRSGRDPDELVAAARAARSDESAIESYRAGHTCHPLLPFADWAACAPALERLGAVLVAGCRDAVAARQLGFVPVHGLGAAFAMARGRADDPLRLGFLLSPPYFPIRVAAT